MTLEAIDHVQVAIPRRGEGAARIFYADFLGLPEQPKPASLADRGGCWFGDGGVKVHCGVEEPFHPANKAHIAFRVDDVAELARRARDRGFQVVEDGSLPGHDRIYIHDPFGNRLEFLRPVDEST
jgi:catechol 2,3-dioxygenase-like lactoylglutathione lyase family enzyme